MNKEFVLKVYMPNSFDAVTLPDGMFNSNVQRENVEIARAYLNKNYPKWYKAVFISKGKRTSQRCLIYPMIVNESINI